MQSSVGHRLGWSILAIFALLSCKGDPSNGELAERALKVEKLPPPPVVSSHVGAGIAHGDSGTARFARALYEEFQAERAMETATFADRFYREPANEGYDAVIDRVAGELR